MPLSSGRASPEAGRPKSFARKGLKTLVLERGRNVVHIKDYPTATLDPWQLPHRNLIPLEVVKENPIASSCYAFTEATQHFFVKDHEHPYEQVKPFHWIRGYQVGGKSLTWGRWTQRWSDLDFEANAKEGIAIDWPIRYKDIAPWYSYVEKFVGISGNRDGIPHLPDGEFLPPMEMNCLEKHFKASIESNYPHRHLDHVPDGQPDPALARPNRLPIPGSLRPGLPLRSIFQQQCRHLARRGSHRKSKLAEPRCGSFHHLRRANAKSTRSARD